MKILGNFMELILDPSTRWPSGLCLSCLPCCYLAVLIYICDSFWFRGFRQHSQHQTAGTPEWYNLQNSVNLFPDM